jgi:hypothetical protein
LTLYWEHLVVGGYAVDDDLRMALVTRISEPFSEDDAALTAIAPVIRTWLNCLPHCAQLGMSPELVASLADLYKAQYLEDAGLEHSAPAPEAFIRHYRGALS